MYSSFFPFQWLAFEAHGLTVQGLHFPESLPIHPRLAKEFQTQWPSIRERILRTPGGFEGACAALLHWEHEPARADRPAHLRIATGYRPYSQGHALKTVFIEHEKKPSPNGLRPGPAGHVQPVPGISWGSSLTTVVLLPNSRVLTGKRGPNMQTNPSLWACLFTEALEPSDISLHSMGRVLDRLAQEELGSIGTLGPHFFMGLVLLPESYTWTLVSALDLRRADPEKLAASLASLQPDHETQAWSTHTLVDDCSAATDTPQLLGLALAKDIAARLSC